MSVSTRPLDRLDASEGELRFAGKDIRQSTRPHKRMRVFRLKKKDGVNSVQHDEWCDVTLVTYSPVERSAPEVVRGGAEKQARAENPLPGGLLKRPADDADLRCEDLGDGPFHTV